MMNGKRCVPYFRVSTDDQADRYSLGVQQELMESWAERNQVILDRYFVDDHSAKDFRRPGFIKLMDYVKKYRSVIDFVLIIDWSRFSRDIKQSYIKIHELEQLGVQVQAIEQMVDDSIPESTIMKAIYLAAPDAENKRRSINVVKGMKKSLRNGEWCTGKVPRGYWRDQNDRKIKTTSEAPVIAEIFTKITKGYSIEDCRKYLEVRGVDISAKTLSKTLRNPFYIGKITNKLLGNDIVDGKHAAIVDIPTFNRVQEILGGNIKIHTITDLYPLKQWAVCGKCGGSFSGYQIKKKQKADGTYREKLSKPIYYKCKCSNVSGKRLHQDFYDILRDLSINVSKLDRFEKILKDTFEDMNQRTYADQRRLQKELTEKISFKKKLEEKFIYGQISSDVYDEHRTSCEKNILEIEKSLKSAKSLSNPNKFIKNSMGMLTKIHDIWKLSDISEKKTLQNLVFPEGIKFDKENNLFLTPRINGIFAIFSAQNGLKSRKAKPEISSNLASARLVVRRGLYFRLQYLHY